MYAVISALWHEVWHIIAYRFYAGGSYSLRGNCYGISLSTELISYKKEMIIALAGPLASLTAFMLFLAVTPFYFNKTVLFFCMSNFALFCINALPVYPLDCGRALLCFLSLKTDPMRAVKLIKVLSYIFLLPVCFLSVIIFLKTGYNLSLLIICLVIMIGVKDL